MEEEMKFDTDLKQNAPEEKFVLALQEIGLSEEMISQCKEIVAEEVKQKGSQFEKEIYDMRLNQGIDSALQKANVVNKIAVKPFLNNLDVVEFDENGDIAGLAEQLENLKNADDTKFLFHQDLGVKFQGVTVGEGSDEEEKRPNFLSMKYSDMMSYLEKNPDAVI